ncbi:MAG: CdaR family protein [Acidobacteriota bacterium]|nr:CdaR family protein [Acidobacteriota bacterium]
MRFLTANLGWKLLSLTLAVAIWLAVASEPEVSTVVSVPVEYKDSPANLAISSQITDSVNLETRGPSGRLGEIRASKLAVILDFSKVLHPGERTFTISRANTNLPRGVRLVRAIPAQLRFDFEQRVTRAVPVVVRFTGKLPSGFRLGGVHAVPDKLRIEGPETRVNRVATVATDPLYLGSITGDSTMRVSTFVEEPQVWFRDSPEVTLKIRVSKSDTLK